MPMIDPPMEMTSNLKVKFSPTSSAHQIHCAALVWLIALMAGLPVLYQADAITVETLNMMGRYMCFAIVALGLDLVWGYTGVLSLCQSLFFTMGGYAVGMHMAMQGKLFNGIPEALSVVYPYGIGEEKGSEVLPWFWVPFESYHLTFILAMLVPAVLAGIIGYFGFISRVKGVYFSILTQALTVAATMFFSKNEMMFCGTNGLTHFKTLLGYDLTNPDVKVGLYYLSLMALLFCCTISFWIVRSRFGKVLIAIRDSENALRFAGYKPHLYKTAIFAFAGGLAGIAGMLYTPQANIITPSYMEAKWSILMVIWVAVGGRGHLSGAVLGALIVNLFYNQLTSSWSIGSFTWNPEYWPIVLGLMFILVVMYLKGGVISLWNHYVNWLTEVPR
jgi:urea transport system permease protein